MAKKASSAPVKSFVLDTNILMRYPNAIYGFDNNEVIITATALDELDGLKDAPGSRGYDAREALRELHELRNIGKERGESFATGIKLNDKGGICRFEHNHIDKDLLPQGWDINKPDHRILSTAKSLRAIVVSEDSGVQLKADAINVPCESYKNAQVKEEMLYTGRSTIALPRKNLKAFLETGEIKAPSELEQNEYITLLDAENEAHMEFGRHIDGKIVKLYSFDKIRDCKVTPRSIGQRFTIDAILNPDIPLVILRGQAGTAKTFLSVAGSMTLYNQNKVSRIIATRNNVVMDKELGYLPGDEEAKMGPLMRGLFDNFYNYLKIQGSDEDMIQDQIDDYLDRGVISIEAMNYMRGRSITDAVLFLDECQNATPRQIMAIATRAGENCKVIISGDPDQIDDPKLDKKNNGLVFAGETMKGSSLCAQIAFEAEECKRSALAREAAIRMSREFA